jgi:hypothetical protein
MIKKICIALLVSFLASTSFGQVSEKVLARWSDGWYVGTVLQKVGDRFKIVFDDGDEALVPQSGIRPLDWSAGTRLQCNFKGSGRYFPGIITQKSGLRITIKYDDGDQEVTLMGRCRVPF